MGLRKQTYLVIALSIALGFSLSVFIVRANDVDGEVTRDLGIVNVLRVKARDLRTVGFEYALYREDRPRVQAQALLKTLPPLLERLRASFIFQPAEPMALWRDTADRFSDCQALLSALSAQTPDSLRQERERQMAHLFLQRATALAAAIETLTGPLLAEQKRDAGLKETVVAASVFVLLLLPLVALVLVRRAVLRPLAVLTGAVRQVAAGNLAHRTGSGDPGEFGELARAFDRMLDRIQEVTVSRDLLEVETAQRRLSEAKYRRLYESLHDAVVAVDMQGRLSEWNGVFRDLLGYTDQDLPLLTMDRLTPGHQAGVPEEIVAGQVLTRGYSDVFEIEFLRQDGLSFPAEVRTFLLRAESGQPAGMWSLVRDITERRRYEAAVCAKEAAEQANRAKSIFVANMSHEIRTPMNAILGLCYLLEQTEQTPVQSDYARKIGISARSLLGIINDILDFSKVEAGRVELSEEPFALDNVMKTLATIVALNARDKNIEVLFHVEPGTPLKVLGDPLRLQQILTNLAGNAIKFTESGEVLLSVKALESDERVARLLFEVRDTGVGIAPDRLGGIFDPFTQVDDSAARRYGGTGLGLAICRRLVTLMRGEVSAVSKPGVGSTFRVTVPLRLQPPALQPLAPQPPDGPAGVPRNLKVLLADDNPTARQVMAAMVAPFGWTLVSVASGEEALAAFDAAVDGDPFDLLLLDWCMPGVDGRRIVQHIRSRVAPEELPFILVVTAFEYERVRRESGGDPLIRSVLTKPVTPSLLLDAVAAVFQTGGADAGGVRVARLTGKPLKGLTLLVVEDNVINQMVARKLLEGAGATVVLAESGAAALSRLAVDPDRFDLVLMDIQMPGMDGYETFRLIRERLALSDLPVVPMTANALPSDRARCLAAGMAEHIGKPFEIERMTAVIARCARRRDEEGGPTGLPAVRGAGGHEAGGHGPGGLGTAIDIKAALVRVMGDMDLLKDLMSEFVRTYFGSAQQLTRDIEAGDFAAVHRVAHELKSVAGNLGALGLYRAAAALDGAARGNDAERTRVHGREVCALLPLAFAAALRFVESGGAESGGAESGPPDRSATLQP